MSERYNYRYRIGFNQSVSSGIFSFDGSINFDDIKESSKEIENLKNAILETQKQFKKAGLRIASDIEPKDNKKNGK